jgi:hypothetical protein
MNRGLTSFVLAAFLAVVISATNAFGVTCGAMAGKSYAILMTGAEYFNGVEPANPAPVATPIVGLGVIQVSSLCTITGELIYNNNDSVTGPGSCTPGRSGVAFGGLSGYVTPTVIPYTGSVPCFTGTNSQLSGSASLNSAGLGTLTLSDSVTGNSFNFSIAAALGSVSWTGTSVATNTGSGNVPPILTIQGQKQGIVPVPSTYGQAPWFGQSTLSCSVVASSDAGQNPGAFISAVGASAVPANNSPQGGGIFNLNLNNAFVPSVAITLPGAPCYTTTVLDTSGAGPFPDGALNFAVTANGPYSGQCAYANLASAWAESGVAWGTNDANKWSIFTAFTSTLSDGAFLPSGDIGACTLTLSLLGKLLGPASILTGGTPKIPRTLKLPYSNSSAMDCLTYFSLSGGSGDCVFAATGTNTQTVDIAPGFSSNTAVELTCTGSDSGATLTATWGGEFPGIPGGPQCALSSNPVTLQ